MNSFQDREHLQLGGDLTPAVKRLIIIDKINAAGLESLTAEEREILKRAAQQRD